MLRDSRNSKKKPAFSAILERSQGTIHIQSGEDMKTNSLAQLIAESHCENCRIAFEGGFDDAVEVTFQVNPNIKDLGEVTIFELMKAWVTLENQPHASHPERHSRAL